MIEEAQIASPAETWRQRGERYKRQAWKWTKKHKKPIIAAGVGLAGVGALTLAGRHASQLRQEIIEALSAAGVKKKTELQPRLTQPYYSSAVYTTASLRNVDPTKMAAKFDEINDQYIYDIRAENFWQHKDQIIEAARNLQKKWGSLKFLQ